MYRIAFGLARVLGQASSEDLQSVVRHWGGMDYICEGASNPNRKTRGKRLVSTKRSALCHNHVLFCPVNVPGMEKLETLFQEFGGEVDSGDVHIKVLRGSNGSVQGL